jgi:hypothetical protein
LGSLLSEAHPPELLEAEDKVRQEVDPAADQHQVKLEHVAGPVGAALVERRLEHKWAGRIFEVVKLFKAVRPRGLKDLAEGACFNDFTLL